MKDHIKQLIKDYENLCEKYVHRRERAIKNNDLLEAAKYNQKFKELSQVVDDLYNM